ncbi:lactonase family protein [Haloparvum sp. AD34]
MSSNQYLAAVGTYSAAEEPGVYTVGVDTSAEKMELLDEVVAGPDPTFVASHPSGEFLYAAVRTEAEGTIKAYDVDWGSGQLEETDSAPSGSLSPCHCSVDPSGEFLFVAHYTGGAVSMLRLTDDGGVTAPADVVQHTGSSVHPERQRAPHPHSISPGPAGRFVYVPDLGTDEILVYEVDRDAGSLSPYASVDVQEGAGPRHLCFGPDGEHVYLINELDSTVVAFDLHDDGTLSRQSVTSTLPDGFAGDNKTAEIAVHPSGDYLFASNRGHDSIATLTTQADELRCLAHTPCDGQWPRHFSLSPDGRHLFVENRDSDQIVGFDVDEQFGTITRNESELAVPQPVCLAWVPEPGSTHSEIV